jgi:hypothetical protein
MKRTNRVVAFDDQQFLQLGNCAVEDGSEATAVRALKVREHDDRVPTIPGSARESPADQTGGSFHDTDPDGCGSVCRCPTTLPNHQERECSPERQCGEQDIAGP